MKPIRLRIQAFGPFSQTESIDFTVLGENPLFLIHGQTGAGKSSILDAMCFALYGRAADDVRDNANLRCDRAAPELECEVEFEFAITHKRYRITRRPTQLLPGRKSETGTRATLVQILDDGSVSLLEERKATNATELIEQITGMKVDQFRQVMVLPQGKFRELLLAKSEEREKILSLLFQTHIYKQIEEVLKERAAEITREKRNQNEQIKGILSTAGQNSEQELKQEILIQEPEFVKQEALTKQSQEQLRQSELALKSAQQLEQQFASLTQITQQLERLNQEQEQQAANQHKLARHRQAYTIKPYMQEFERRQQELIRGEQGLVRTQQELQALQEAGPELLERLNKVQEAMQTKPSLDIRLNHLHSLKDQFSKIQTQEAQLQQLARSKKTQTEQLQQLTQQLEQQQLGLKAAQQAEQNKWRVSEEVTKLTHQRQQIIEDGHKARKLKNLLTEAGALKQSADVLESKQAQAKLRFDGLKEQRMQLELTWHQGQAALLAKQLQAGEACPVCGSLDHPHKAYSDDIIVVEQHQLEHAREAEEKARQTWQALKEQWQQELTKLQGKQDEVQKWREENPQLPELDGLVVQHKQVDTTLKAKQQEVNTLEAQAKNTELITQTLKTLQEQVEQTRVQLSQAERAEGVSIEQLKQLQQALPKDIQSQEQLIQATVQCQAQIQQLEQTYQQAQVAQKKHEQELASTNTQIHERTQSNQTIRQDVQEKQAHLQQLWQENSFSDRQACQDALMLDDEAEQLAQSIERYKQAMAHFNSQKVLLQEQLEGKERPDLSVLQEQFNVLQTQHQQHSQHLEEKRLALHSLQKATKLLVEIQEKQQVLEQQYQVLGTMSEMASGNNPDRITLQRFVLSVILEEVLENASHRLQYLSDGRYDLVRRQTVKGRGQAGLDIDVFDVYSGQTRMASTLSGGESFLASLALALGLSDVVQQRSGGIKLDTLFIDEGFGSLDPGSLELAINSLLELRRSGRMIGIISHVSELKEQIHLGLEVKSNPAGSHVLLHGVA